MKAFLYDRYGDATVVHEATLPKPVPKEREVLVRVIATTVSTGDWRARSLEMPSGFGLFARPVFGFFSPRQPILGTELAGVIEAVGAAVTKWKVGDAVFAFPGSKLGCHAEYRCIAEDGPLAHKPCRLDFEQAAALSFGGSTALDVFARGKLKRGERVLVNGASGCVGSACVQIAKAMGAHVTAVCSAGNAAIMRSIGADETIDYAREDFARGKERYDVIVDTVGTAPYARARAALTDDGRLLVVLGTLGALFTAAWVNATSKHRIVTGPAAERPEYVRELAALAERGAYTPLVDTIYPWDALPEAHRRVEGGHKRGSVVVRVGTPDATTQLESA